MPAHARPHGQSRGPVRRHGVVSTTIGVIGELFITAGVFLGLFVVWQLWWTDVEANREHQQIVADLDWEAAPATTPTEHREPPPVMEEPAEGTVFATFYVPRWGQDYQAPIAQGIDKKTVLDRLGIGHYPGTAMPGDLGNFAVAGHRTTYGRPFNLVAELKPGDPLVVRTKDVWYVYKMTSNQIVYPNQVEVIAPIPGTKEGDPVVEPTQRFITLTACHPMFSARQRFIVHGELDYWTPVSEGTPKELTEAGVNVTVGASGASSDPASTDLAPDTDLVGAASSLSTALATNGDR